MIRGGGLKRTRRLALLAVGAATAVLALAAYSTDLLESLELDSVDSRFTIRGDQPVPDDLVVVAIDDVTFDELGVQWPFPRSLHGRLIDRLRRAGVRVVAYDVQFTEPTTPAEDNALIQEVARAGAVVLSTTEVNDRGQSNVFGGEAVLRQIGARAGNSVVTPDSDAIVRKFPIVHDGLTGFAAASAEEATGEAVDSSALGGDESAWIDYRGPPGTIRTVPFSRVLSGQVPARVLRDKVVVVGAAAPSLQDVHPTAMSGGRLMPGPEIQANAIWTAERGFPLRSSWNALDVVLIALLAFVAPAATIRFRPAPALGVAVAAAGVYAIAAQLAFDAGRVLPVVYPLGALALATVGSLSVNYLITAFERQRIRDTFSRFVPEAVVEEVLSRPDGDLRFGGVRREGTVLFSDLRSFTSFSETLEPDLVVELLNRYLGEMSEAIMDHGGTLTAYMGDGIMAVFGAPIEQPDHAERALAAAQEMLTERLPRFNEWMRSRGLGDGFRMGVGLNSGVMMSGQVGSEKRVEYTAIGDVVNTASRLEGMTKGTPFELFVSESTHEQLGAQGDGLVFAGEFEVRGRAQQLRVWGLEVCPGKAKPEFSEDA